MTERLIPFKYSINQAIASLYSLRVSNSLCSSSLVNPAEIITGFPFSGCKKAYFKCSGNSFSIKPSELLFSSATSSLYLLDLSALFSLILNTESFSLKLSSEIQLQDAQDTRNSSHSHSLNSKSYNQWSVQN